jgi:hypothetical protein
MHSLTILCQQGLALARRYAKMAFHRFTSQKAFCKWSR